MRKAQNMRLSVVQQQQSDGNAASTTTFFCRRCWLTLFHSQMRRSVSLLFFLPFSLSPPLFVIGTLGLMLKTPSSLLIPLILFNFTLDSSIYDIKENILELKEQLRMGLQLMPNEIVLIHVTNNKGSTKDPPVTLEASVVSDIETLQSQRLKQIARIITRSPPAENLGLNHTVFGKVKEISLSSFLKHSLHAPAPTPSPCPAPSPEHIPLMAPAFSPSFPPKFQHSLSPCPNCYTSSLSDAGQIFAPSPHPIRDFPPSPPPMSNSPEPSVAHRNQCCVPTDSPCPSPTSHVS